MKVKAKGSKSSKLHGNWLVHIPIFRQWNFALINCIFNAFTSVKFVGIYPNIYGIDTCKYRNHQKSTFCVMNFIFSKKKLFDKRRIIYLSTKLIGIRFILTYVNVMFVVWHATADPFVRITKVLNYVDVFQQDADIFRTGYWTFQTSYLKTIEHVGTLFWPKICLPVYFAVQTF